MISTTEFAALHRPFVALLPALLAAVVGFACAVWHARATAQSAQAEPTMRETLTLLHQQRHAEAFGRLVVLADRGDAGAALLALAMLRIGPEAYGTGWSATPGQVRRWSAMATREAQRMTPAVTAPEHRE